MLTALLGLIFCFKVHRSESIAFGTSKAPPSSSAPSETRQFRNRFQFIPYGSPLPTSHLDNENTCDTTICCDGRIPGASLELTHWDNNETPKCLYADTSTEIALKFAKARLFGQPDETMKDAPIQNFYEEFDSSTVVNNHFDTDGVLSVFALLYPREALRHETLLVQGAEAGDFGEWPSDAAVKLDCALHAVLERNNGNDEEAYKDAIGILPEILRELEELEAIQTTKEEAKVFEPLWSNAFRTVKEDWKNIECGKAVLKSSHGMALLMEPETTDDNSSSHISPYALHRALKDQPALRVNRILRAQKVTLADGPKWIYQYEKPGHGWVKKLVQREVVPAVDVKGLVDHLNAGKQQESWCKGGSGLISICKTQHAIEMEPKDVMKTISTFDEDGMV